MQSVHTSGGRSLATWLRPHQDSAGVELHRELVEPRIVVDLVAEAQQPVPPAGAGAVEWVEVHLLDPVLLTAGTDDRGHASVCRDLPLLAKSRAGPAPVPAGVPAQPTSDDLRLVLLRYPGAAVGQALTAATRVARGLAGLGLALRGGHGADGNRRVRQPWRAGDYVGSATLSAWMSVSAPGGMND